MSSPGSPIIIEPQKDNTAMTVLIVLIVLCFIWYCCQCCCASSMLSPFYLAAGAIAAKKQ